jgi:hypothetical protein
VAAADEPNAAEKLLTGYDAAGKTFKVHLDGYNRRACCSPLTFSIQLTFFPPSHSVPQCAQF